MVVQKLMGLWNFRNMLLLLFSVMALGSCGGDEASDMFTPGFKYDFIDENHVRFTNQSEGEYHLLNWNFGNGRTEVSTTKSQTFEVYYPEAGNYVVSLELIGLEGDRKSTSQTVTISKNDLVVSFTATVDGARPNYVNLANTSVGTFDSFKWVYRNKVIENQSNAVAYFPYSGNYEVELQLVKNGVTYSSKQTVSIASNDPDYYSKFSLVWSDEFDGNAVNTNNWTFETGSGGWGNNELQNYTAGDNAEVKDGILTITARKVNDNKVAGSYTSTRMITGGKKEFTYGRMEIRAKLPSGTGIWPAIWMLGGNIGSVGWPACGEIDIMEYVGYQPNTIHATVHTSAGFGGNGSGSSKTLETAEEEFHIYGLIWTEKEMIFYTDTPENVTHRYAPSNKTAENWPFDKPQFFILNVAVGGNWGGAQGVDNTIFPQSMEVDYMKVFQED
ncbi:PKD domain-containing protein [Maribellus luteus]|uniref:PKD domain-containing protein n=2 Tax=Maribellus luteus TaxID=2305463 RepID=A0A399T3Q6_9BACT|nr:PKD domain-containing protein [Maribellus luteus]